MARSRVVPGEESTLVQARVNETLAVQLDELAARRGTTRSKLMREAMQLLLEQEVAAS